VNRADIVYSPEGTARQYARGRWARRSFPRGSTPVVSNTRRRRTRAKYDKTPDILMHKPLEMNGSRKYWIESKATFGDPYEIRSAHQEATAANTATCSGTARSCTGSARGRSALSFRRRRHLSPRSFETPPPLSLCAGGETRLEERALLPDAVDLPE